LEALANDTRWVVRLAVARNPGTSQSCLAILANDESLGG
jgi:hypothetical protein